MTKGLETGSSAESSYTFAKKLVLGLMIALILGSFVSVEWAKVKRNYNSAKSDQGAYLLLGLNIREHKALTDGNRPPLYPALLSLFAEREWDYFTKAKLLSLTIGTVGLAIVYLLSRQMYNEDIAVLTMLLLSVNDEFRRESSMVMCEALLVLLFFLTWYYMVKGFSKWQHWIAAGFCGGLAYLTKGTGLLLLISFIPSVLIVYRAKIIKKMEWLVLPAVYLATAAILLTYNYRIYGNPSYNFHTVHGMWLNDWEEQYVASPDSLPTARTYLATHTLSDIGVRELAGIKAMKLGLILALIPAKSWFIRDFFYSPLSLLFIIALVATLVHFRKDVVSFYNDNREKIFLSALLFALFYLSFAWYVLGKPEPRFLLPLAPIIYLFIAESMYKLGRELSTRLFPKNTKLALVAYIAFYTLLASWVLSISGEATQYITLDPFWGDRLRNDHKEKVMLWLEQQGEPGTAVIYGPSHSLPTWKYANGFAFIPIPFDITTWDSLADYFSQKEARYVILDEETFERRSSLLGCYFKSDEGKISFYSLPIGWELVYASGGLPCDYCIFELDRARSRERGDYSVGRSFGDEIRLLGYDLDISRIDSEDKVYLTLYWQALQSMDEDYEVYLKLINGVYKVWGQQRGQPVSGIFPTSQWTKGQVVKDKREIDILPGTPPGSYRIDVSLHDPELNRWLKSGEGDVLLGPVEVPRRKPPAINSLDIEHPLEANLGNRICLLGYNIKSGFRPGDEIHLTLFWQALAKIDEDYTVFTHLIDGEGNIWGQKDNQPVDGFYPTTAWGAGGFVRDQYDLLISPQAPSGGYRIQVGMYRAETGERLIVSVKEGQVRDDKVLLGEVQIRP